MRIATNRVEAFVRVPDARARALLVYGPNEGLVRERAQRLARTVVEDPADPFRVTVFASAALAEAPGRLVDEAASLCLTGGRRLVRVPDATDGVCEAFAQLFAASAAEALVVAEAGDLPPRSRLRQLFEKADVAAALPCYADEGAALEGLIEEMLGAAAIAVEPDAMTYLVDRLGSDRLLIRSELDKLVTYMAARPEGATMAARPEGATLSLEDARASVGDGATLSLDALAFACAGGDQARLERAYSLVLAASTSPIAALRAAARHLMRLHAALALTGRGQTPETAMERLRPKVFYKDAPAFRRQMEGWSPARLVEALTILVEAEIACKSTGMPDHALAQRALMRIARAARLGLTA